MKLIWTNDDGYVIDQWHIDAEQVNRYCNGDLRSLIEQNLPISDDNFNSRCQKIRMRLDDIQKRLTRLVEN